MASSGVAVQGSEADPFQSPKRPAIPQTSGTDASTELAGLPRLERAARDRADQVHGAVPARQVVRRRPVEDEIQDASEPEDIAAGGTNRDPAFRSSRLM